MEEAKGKNNKSATGACPSEVQAPTKRHVYILPTPACSFQDQNLKQ